MCLARLGRPQTENKPDRLRYPTSNPSTHPPDLQHFALAHIDWWREKTHSKSIGVLAQPQSPALRTYQGFPVCTTKAKGLAECRQPGFRPFYNVSQCSPSLAPPYMLVSIQHCFRRVHFQLLKQLTPSVLDPENPLRRSCITECEHSLPGTSSLRAHHAATCSVFASRSQENPAPTRRARNLPFPQYTRFLGGMVCTSLVKVLECTGR